MNDEKITQQTDGHIFALDIGTRTVVGILGHKSDDNFIVDDWYSLAHKVRAMTDGQIEDINEVAKVALRVKKRIEENNGIKLKNVAIAAAGRTLKTCRTRVDVDIEDKGYINEDMLKFIETEAVFKSQSSLEENHDSSVLPFYCVGNTAVKYYLDDYPIKSLLGHRGKTASAEIIAAFLPGAVVESLYSVMDLCSLTVTSLTLEPIAAMNVIIPPEVRLINIALVDIGAGTSDIAISKDGSIVAYAMATIAGDEITEEIIKKYLVDFNTAEQMKQDSHGKEIKYTNILGMENTIETDKFFESLFPTVDLLAETISKNILDANGGESPAAVFLVGGGSKVPLLTKYVADKLEIPPERVTVGSRRFMRNVDTGKLGEAGPEFVTPIGIGITATIRHGYDFSTITLNDKKLRVFDTRKITVVDLLRIAGYKPGQIIGRSGRSLVFMLNGERKSVSGIYATPSQVKINGKEASIDSHVNHGDTVTFVPAQNGKNAEMSVAQLAGDYARKSVFIDGDEYPFGTFCIVNETEVSSEYMIQNYDDVKMSRIETLGELMLSLPFDAGKLVFMKGDRKLRFDYVLNDNDKLVTVDVSDKVTENKVSESVSQKSDDKNTDILTVSQGAPITVILNGKPTLLEQTESEHEFLELMALVDLDTKNPPKGKNIAVTLNGKDASFMDKLKEGDVAVVGWR